MALCAYYICVCVVCNFSNIKIILNLKSSSNIIGIVYYSFSFTDLLSSLQLKPSSSFHPGCLHFSCILLLSRSFLRIHCLKITTFSFSLTLLSRYYNCYLRPAPKQCMQYTHLFIYIHEACVVSMCGRDDLISKQMNIQGKVLRLYY